MSEQSRIYLLYDVRDFVYVGQTTKGNLDRRLLAHTRNRLKTRWNRFPWFGFRPVADNESLGPTADSYELREVVSAMETLLTEVLEPSSET